MTNRFRNVFTQEIWGSSPKSKNLNILKKTKQKQKTEKHTKNAILIQLICLEFFV